MTDVRTPPPAGDDVLAGELALGVLEGEAQRVAIDRVATDPPFAAEVERWHHRLGGLLARVPAITPPSHVWQGIARRIPANDDRPPASALPLRAWQAASAGLGLIAASLAFVLVTRSQPAPPPPPIVRQTAETVLMTQLANAEGQPLLVARYDPLTGQLRVRADNLEPGPREPELWVIGPDATPRSLGLLPRGTAVERAPDPRLHALLVAGSTFALTLEPRAGAPHAAPTGTILATGKLAPL